jgi:hypothetical protein
MNRNAAILTFCFFENLKTRKLLGFIDDLQIGAGEGNRTLVFIPKTITTAISRIQPVITGEIHLLTPLFTTFEKYFPRNAITDHCA